TRHSTRWRTPIGLFLATGMLAACLAGPAHSMSPALPSASTAPTPGPTTEPTHTPSATPEPTPDQAKVPIFQAGAMAATRTTGRLTPAGGKAVIFLKTSASDAPAPGTVQPSFFAQHPTLRGDLFMHVDSDCSWALSVVRLPL